MLWLCPAHVDKLSRSVTSHVIYCGLLLLSGSVLMHNVETIHCLFILFLFFCYIGSPVELYVVSITDLLVKES